MEQKTQDLQELLDDAAQTVIRERSLPKLTPVQTASGIRFVLDTGADLGILVIRANGNLETRG
jgi:hypothetical protein